MAQANKRRYVFHFDLNNTILMKDDAKGLGVVDNVSQLESLRLIEVFIIKSCIRSVASSVKVPGAN